MDEKKGEAILPEEPQTETAAEESPKGFTRRQVVAGGIGVGLVGLIAGGALAKWGVIEDTIASGRVAVRPNYNFGEGSNGPDGIYRNCQFTVEHCKQCKDAACMKNCPVHAIYADPETGARVVDTDKCIGCGLCHEACPWNMPQIDPVIGKSTKCIACGRCAVQCPNGAIKFVDWQDIAQEAIDKGIVRTSTLFPEA